MSKKINVVPILNLLVDELGISVTRQTIKDEVSKHPRSNSLLAIHEILENWKVPNVSYQLSFDQLINSPIKAPFIANLTYVKQEFTLVKHIDTKHVIVSNRFWNNHKLSLEEFKERYKETVLIAEKQANSGEANYTEKHIKEKIDQYRIPFLISSVLILLTLFLSTHPSYVLGLNWQISLLILLKTTGLATAVLLLVQAIDANNPLIEKFCGTNPKRNCGAILSSKAAKINEYLTWSEVGFFYFAGTWLVLLFNSSSSSLIYLLAILNILSLPYTFYSIYYQWRIAKQWCIFCCTVQALLWMEFFIFLPYLQSGAHSPNLAEWINFLIALAFPVLVWEFILPFLTLSARVPLLIEKIGNLKSNPDIFRELHKKQEQYTLLPDEDSLILGNPEAKNIITLVSNLYCSECAKAHQLLHEWLEYRDDIKVQIVFPIKNVETDSRSKIATHLMSIQSTKNHSLLKEAFHNWYEKYNGKIGPYESWATDYPVKLNNYNDALKKQSEWCDMADTVATPVIYLNGRKLPKTHQLIDIKYYLTG